MQSVLVPHVMHILLQNRNPGQTKAALFTKKSTGKRYLCKLVGATSGRLLTEVFFRPAFRNEDGRERGNMGRFGLEEDQINSIPELEKDGGQQRRTSSH